MNCKLLTSLFFLCFVLNNFANFDVDSIDSKVITDNDIIGAYKVMAGKSISTDQFIRIKTLVLFNNWQLQDLALFYISQPEVRLNLGLNWLRVSEIKSDIRSNIMAIKVPQILDQTNYTDSEIIGAYRVMTGKNIDEFHFGLCKERGHFLSTFLLVLDDTMVNLKMPPLQNIPSFPITLSSGYTIFGYESDKIVAEPIARNGSWEPYMEKIMSKILKPGFVAVDIGANIGYFTALFAKEVGTAGKVLAFEILPPLISLLEKFKLYNDLDQVAIFPYGLSDVSKNVFMKVNPITPAGSQVINDNEVEFFMGKIPDSIYQVQVRAFDEVVKDTLERIDLIKIDVEGMEDLVLKGADKKIRQFYPTIIWELNPTLYSKRGVSTMKLLEYYQSLGYCFGIVRDLVDELDPIAAILLNPLSAQDVLDYLDKYNLNQIDVILYKNNAHLIERYII